MQKLLKTEHFMTKGTKKPSWAHEQLPTCLRFYKSIPLLNLACQESQLLTSSIPSSYAPRLEPAQACDLEREALLFDKMPESVQALASSPDA
eukprot:1158198-Pelagomonas_calceolata.AAC.2